MSSHDSCREPTLKGFLHSIPWSFKDIRFARMGRNITRLANGTCGSRPQLLQLRTQAVNPAVHRILEDAVKRTIPEESPSKVTLRETRTTALADACEAIGIYTEVELSHYLCHTSTEAITRVFTIEETTHMKQTLTANHTRHMEEFPGYDSM